MISANVAPSASTRAPSLAEAHSVAVPYRLSVYVACTLLALFSNYLIGKEMAWDTLSYHLYAGLGATHDRFAQDYFAAGPQSYFNPYAYVPFYALVSAGLPALAIGSILAAIHSVILWLTFDLAVLVCPPVASRTHLLFGICAVAMAFINPILIQQLGSSFADITTGELVLGGWLMLASAVCRPRVARIVGAGILLGAATALKPTNAVHAISAFTLLLFLPMNLGGRIRQAFWCACATGASFAIIAGPWAYGLEHSFGNPFFPLLNNVFRSPEFTTEPLRHLRFVPYSLSNALWRPFAMIDPTRMVHEELRAPDPRYAVLVLLAMGSLALRWWPRVAPAPVQSEALNRADSGRRTLIALSCGFAADWILWLGGSGNSRYFLPMSSVAAVLIVALLFRLCASRPKLRNYILVAIFATQTVQLWMGAEFRWKSVPWGGPWFNVAVPDRLAREPNLYLSAGAATDSFLAAFLAPGSGFVNFSGGYALTSEANRARVDALIRRYEPRMRILTRGSRLYRDEERRLPTLAGLDDALWRFGLRVDSGNCSTITVYGLPHDLEVTVKGSMPFEWGPRNNTDLVTCRVIPDSRDHSAQIARERAVDLVLDRLEDACPQLFQPRRPGTEQERGVWRRVYINTDLTAWVSHGWVKFQDPTRGDGLVLVGRESDWANAPPRLICGRHDGHFFAKVLEGIARH